MAQVLQIVRSAPAFDRADVQRDTRRLADLMQSLALRNPAVIYMMLRFAQKMVAELPPS